MRVVVVGAGVIGLTCAVRLAEAGFDTHVLARDLPPETTSSVAAALWYPYRAAPPDAVTRWSARTYEVFCALAESDPGSGVRVRPGTELLPAQPDGAEPAAPWWRSAVPALDVVRDPAPGYAWGWRLDLPIADTTTYLPWLVARLAAAGGTLTRAWLPALPTSGLVVNATGLAARALTSDDGLQPVRGQIVRVEQVGIADWLLAQHDDGRPLYVVPRERDVVVGGTAEEGQWDPAPRAELAQELLDRATVLVPALRHARVLGSRVGLRPGRPAVRLESHPHDDGSPGGVVHCYGHGGAGITMSWGCADDVLREVHALAGQPAAADSSAR
jgi:D-amino-acid oxidase